MQRRDLADERGDIVSSWFLKVFVMIAIVAFLLYEGLAMAITGIQLDGTARDIALVASTAYIGSENEELMRAEAQAAAALAGVTIVDIHLEENVVVVTVTKTAPTLVAHRIGFFEDLCNPSASARDSLRS